jgi:hypothetical protein
MVVDAAKNDIVVAENNFSLYLHASLSKKGYPNDKGA